MLACKHTAPDESPSYMTLPYYSIIRSVISKNIQRLLISFIHSMPLNALHTLFLSQYVDLRFHGFSLKYISL